MQYMLLIYGDEAIWANMPQDETARTKSIWPKTRANAASWSAESPNFDLEHLGRDSPPCFMLPLRNGQV
jgi:hypothetical protein